MNKKGFTLIEVTVVVGVLALIMAIAIPNFTESRRSAIDSICVSNAKTLESLVMQMVIGGSLPIPNSHTAEELKTFLEGGQYIDEVPVCVMGEYICAWNNVVYCTG